MACFFKVRFNLSPKSKSPSSHLCVIEHFEVTTAFHKLGFWRCTGSCLVGCRAVYLPSRLGFLSREKCCEASLRGHYARWPRSVAQVFLA
ncbi:hypothetical protein CEXT_398711 [Caerostris extrusa]|uniref:Uncharacterized protein n=1 Tax=Caerostris extrusa TaxID=172846 RepID=A0AAV4PNZ3_CAEEX|nr:hypothetical protein CEXT_398711 [Caerostris extrusa]